LFRVIKFIFKSDLLCLFQISGYINELECAILVWQTIFKTIEIKKWVKLFKYGRGFECWQTGIIQIGEYIDFETKKYLNNCGSYKTNISVDNDTIKIKARNLLIGRLQKTPFTHVTLLRVKNFEQDQHETGIFYFPYRVVIIPNFIWVLWA
jgi:hypothetical protein